MSIMYLFPFQVSKGDIFKDGPAADAIVRNYILKELNTVMMKVDYVRVNRNTGYFRCFFFIYLKNLKK